MEYVKYNLFKSSRDMKKVRLRKAFQVLALLEGKTQKNSLEERKNTIFLMHKVEKSNSLYVLLAGQRAPATDPWSCRVPSAFKARQ